MKRQPGKRRFVFLVTIIAPLFLLLLFIFLTNIWVTASTQSAVFRYVPDVGPRDVALVLGTSKSLVGGADNPHFQHRIQAAANLFHQKKVKHILVSGHRSDYYNEPEDMQKALMELKVPKTAITCDFDGDRTLDSVVRATQVFGVKNMVVVSDEFHVSRALFIANSFEIDAVAFASADVSYAYSAKTRAREYFARIKAVLDLYILHPSPDYSGERSEIKVTAR